MLKTTGLKEVLCNAKFELPARSLMELQAHHPNLFGEVLRIPEAELYCRAPLSMQITIEEVKKISKGSVRNAIRVSELLKIFFCIATQHPRMLSSSDARGEPLDCLLWSKTSDDEKRVIGGLNTGGEITAFPWSISENVPTRFVALPR